MMNKRFSRKKYVKHWRYTWITSDEEKLHDRHLSCVFQRVQQYNMKLNLEKCAFGTRAAKFLDFYLTRINIKANSNKCEAIIQMETPTMKKEAIRVNEMLTNLNMFISKSSQHTLPFYQPLKKKHTLNKLQNTRKHLHP